MDEKYPPFSVTPKALRLVSEIERLLGQVDLSTLVRQEPMLRRQNRVRSVKDSLAIEGNSLSLDQATAIFDKKRVIGPKNEIREIQNAIEAYAAAGKWRSTSERDFKKAHGIMMAGLLASVGKYRAGAVGIMKGERISHIAPGAKQLPQLMGRLFSYAERNRDLHPLVMAAVLHYEIEYIHPFEDGNGRMGRLWQHLVLREYHQFFETVPFESVIKAKQKRYYRVLELCDKAGHATKFVEFALETTAIALKEVVTVTPRRRSTTKERISFAETVFKKKWFSRKDYISLFADISLPTASRDLAQAVKEKAMSSRGEKNQTQYRYR
ncbi:MAG TPA: Fic family protein [Turneriella sp.]|nr:Fic family protein [Turneriella sp.]